MDGWRVVGRNDRTDRDERKDVREYSVKNNFLLLMRAGRIESRERKVGPREISKYYLRVADRTFRFSRYTGAARGSRVVSYCS